MFLKILAVKGRSGREFLGRKRTEKTSSWREKRCGGAEGCRRDGECDGTGSLRSGRRWHLEYTWRDLFGGG